MTARWGTFQLAQKMPGGEKMVAMTRILHRTTPDEIMDEVRSSTSHTAVHRTQQYIVHSSTCAAQGCWQDLNMQMNVHAYKYWLHARSS